MAASEDSGGVLDALLSATADDIVRGLVPEWAPGRRLAGVLAGPLARRFVDELLATDAVIGSRGLAAAGDELLARFSGPVSVRGADRVPASGGLLVVANHPGAVDTPLLWHALAARPDLLVVALDRPFLRGLPRLAERLLYVGDPVAGRVELVRRAAHHLRAGGALLSFPAGTTEPDPTLRPVDAVGSLARWSGSTGLLVRLAPGTLVLPVAVAGVIGRRGLRHPLARVRRGVDARELAGAIWQVMAHDRSIRPRVVVGEPFSPSRHGLDAELRDRMGALLEAALQPAVGL